MITKLRALKNHEGFMRYFRNTSWLFGEKILRMIVGLFVGVWVARYLGPEQFGLFNYALSFVGLFTAITTLGLDSIVVRELIHDESRRNEVLGTAFWLKLIGAFGLLAILAIAVNFTSNDSYTNTLVFIIASATIFQSFNVVDMYFQSKVMGKYVTYSNVIGLLASSIVKIALIFYEAPLTAFAWTVLFDNVVLAMGYMYFYLQNRLCEQSNTNQSNLLLAWKFKKSTAMSLLKDSWPFILSSLVITIYTRIDQIMLKLLLNNEAVGQFTAAVKLSETIYFIPVVIMSSIFPSILNAKKHNEESYYLKLQILYDIMGLIALVIVLPIFFCSNWIATLLYGSAYDQVAHVLMVLIWVAVFTFSAVVTGQWMLIENLQKYNLIFNLLGVILVVILNYLLIPIYGAIGAAFATLLSRFISSFYILFISKRIFIMQYNSFVFWKAFRRIKTIGNY